MRAAVSQLFTVTFAFFGAWHSSLIATRRRLFAMLLWLDDAKFSNLAHTPWHHLFGRHLVHCIFVTVAVQLLNMFQSCCFFFAVFTHCGFDMFRHFVCCTFSSSSLIIRCSSATLHSAKFVFHVLCAACGTSYGISRF